MSITLETAFQLARDQMPNRRGGLYDPGILVRIDFGAFAVQVNDTQKLQPWDRPPESLFGVNADDLRTIWEFWPADRQTDWFDPQPLAGAADMLVSGLRSVRTGQTRDGAFLGQFRIVERPGMPYLFAPTHPLMRAFASPLSDDGGGRYSIERTLTNEEVEAARPVTWDSKLKERPIQLGGWISLRLSVLGVSYVA